MFTHVSPTSQRQLLVRHHQIIHASSAAIIRAWCDPRLFIRFHETAPGMGVTFSMDLAARHQAAIIIGSPDDDIRERLPLCMTYELGTTAGEQHIAGPDTDPYAMRLSLTLSPTLHLVSGRDTTSSDQPRTSCMLSFSATDGEAYEAWAQPLLTEALPSFAEALAQNASGSLS